MKTTYFCAKNSSSLNKAINFLLKGEIVAFPTETVYGLGACYHSKEALHKLYKVKKRNPSKPIAIFLDCYKNIKNITQEIPEQFWKLGELFFPGPLTIVFSSGKETLGIRVPKHELCRQIIKRTGPLYVTSANRSTELDLTSPVEVYQTFNGLIAGVLVEENIRLTYNLPSTVIQIQKSGSLQLLREGPISWNEINRFQ